MSAARALARSLKNFIDEHPVDIVVTRTERVSDGAGGFRDLPPADLPPQRVRVVQQNLRGAATALLMPAGDIDRDVRVVVGPVTTDLKRGDEFSYDGARWEVGVVTTGPYDSKQAEAHRVGG